MGSLTSNKSVTGDKAVCMPNGQSGQVLILALFAVIQIHCVFCLFKSGHYKE